MKLVLASAAALELVTSALFSHSIGTSGLRLSEGCCAATILRETETIPDADRV